MTTVTLFLAEHGATFCLVVRRLKELEAVASSSRAMPPGLLPYPVDLTQDADPNQLVARAQRFWRAQRILRSKDRAILGAF
jgi:NADP-dependent 3-hydroxy acid dehydrogenase YdfG